MALKELARRTSAPENPKLKRDFNACFSSLLHFNYGNAVADRLSVGAAQGHYVAFFKAAQNLHLRQVQPASSYCHTTQHVVFDPVDIVLSRFRMQRFAGDIESIVYVC